MKKTTEQKRSPGRPTLPKEAKKVQYNANLTPAIHAYYVGKYGNLGNALTQLHPLEVERDKEADLVKLAELMDRIKKNQ